MSPRIPWMLTCCGLLAACGSGSDLVGVRAATAVRDADDHVTVTAILTCVSRDGSLGGDCDADGEEHCVMATWDNGYSPSSTKSITSGVQCVTPPRVEGATVLIRSLDPVPRQGAFTIQLGFTPRVVIDSP
ncbi:hypothetical protein ACIHQR_04090 [Corallococcus coralloides]|uniref:hypothetical protein n=1 Tax=Corallococcus coralloides TaxID=184914 RepID=UPI00384A9931